jgi:hypothetical protein
MLGKNNARLRACVERMYDSWFAAEKSLWLAWESSLKGSVSAMDGFLRLARAPVGRVFAEGVTGVASSAGIYVDRSATRKEASDTANAAMCIGTGFDGPSVFEHMER